MHCIQNPDNKFTTKNGSLERLKIFFYYIIHYLQMFGMNLLTNKKQIPKKDAKKK